VVISQEQIELPAPLEQPISVLLVDRLAMVREGLGRILTTEADIRVAGSSSAGTEALALAPQLRPDVIILDADLPDIMGMIARLRADVPMAGVLILAATHDTAHAVALVRAGVRGYLCKRATGQELIAVVYAVGRGQLSLDTAVLTSLVDTLAHRETAIVDISGPPREELSERELEVLRLLCQGRTDKAIAQRLYLSVRTVNSHVSHIYAKLGVGTRTEAMQLALQHGLVLLPPASLTTTHP
jgi:DNA-binding NarL/FixJ family response regulator